MNRKTYFAVAIVALSGFALAFADPKEPENGPELAKLLREKYGVSAYLNRDRQVWMAIVEQETDARKAVERLSRVDTLERIKLMGARVDQELLKTLGKLPKLWYLAIDGCQVRDPDLEAIKELENLKELDLSNTPITDAGLAYLKPLQKLERLRLNGTKITGREFKHLQSLPQLRGLYLHRTPITDESLAAIGKIYSLKVLSLGDTAISDTGIEHLTGLYQLFEFAATVNVTQTGKEAFIKEHALARTAAEKKGLIPRTYPQLKVMAGPKSEKPRNRPTKVL